jgi:cholesterol oxidase
MRSSSVPWLAVWLLLTAFATPPADYPAVIVGSGFGGSVAAYNLARAGVPVLVIERGRWWKLEDPKNDQTFATLPSVEHGDGKASWLADECRGNVYLSMAPAGTYKCPVTTGILEVIGGAANPYDQSPAIRAEGIATLTAAGVGGGSLVYNGVSYAPLKEAWDIAFLPAELPHMQQVWRELQAGRYFERVLSTIAPAPVPLDVLNTDAYATTRRMRDDAIAAGYPLEDGTRASRRHGTVMVPVAAEWNVVRRELEGQRTAAATIGEAWWGLNSGAKHSLDNPDHYLGRALETGLVEVAALHTVTRIRFDPATELYSVHVLHTDEDYRELERRVITTRHLIMSAGSMGTTKLLVRARDTGDLPLLNAAVGTRWSSNGLGNAFRFVVRDSVAAQGGPAGIKMVNFDDPTNPVVLENLPQRVPASFGGDPKLAPFLGAAMMIGLGIPTATGEFHYDPGSDTVVLSWPPDAATNVYDKFASMVTELGGATQIPSQPAAQAVSAHPLGGMPLGLATDLHCRVIGYEHLYAVDGSVVPGAAAATNPSVLIAALAQRCMDKITLRILGDRW